MATGYIDLPAGGIPVYPSATQFPIVSDDGDQAVAADTNTIYIYDSSVPGWQAVATPGPSIAITALLGDVTATGPGAVNSTVNFVGTASAASVATATNDVINASPIANPNEIVRRDADAGAEFGQVDSTIVTTTGTTLDHNFKGRVTGLANQTLPSINQLDFGISFQNGSTCSQVYNLISTNNFASVDIFNNYYLENNGQTTSGYVSNLEFYNNITTVGSTYNLYFRNNFSAVTGTAYMCDFGMSSTSIAGSVYGLISSVSSGSVSGPVIQGISNSFNITNVQGGNVVSLKETSNLNSTTSFTYTGLEITPTTANASSAIGAKINMASASGTTVKALDVTGNSDFSGNVSLVTAGNKLKIKEGTNASMGVTAAFPGTNPNTVTVNTTAVGANSRIFLSVQSNPGNHQPDVYSNSRVAGTSFTIRAHDNNFNGTVAWLIIDPA